MKADYVGIGGGEGGDGVGGGGWGWEREELARSGGGVERRASREVGWGALE